MLRRVDTGGSYVGHAMQSQHPSMPSPPLYPDGEDMERAPSHETADSTADQAVAKFPLSAAAFFLAHDGADVVKNAGGRSDQHPCQHPAENEHPAHAQPAIECLADEPADLTIRLLREIRAEMRDQRSLLLSLTSFTQRLDRRMDQLDHRLANLKDDLELMIKAELMGAMSHRDIQLDERLAQIEERMGALETGGKHGPA